VRSSRSKQGDSDIRVRVVLTSFAASCRVLKMTEIKRLQYTWYVTYTQALPPTNPNHQGNLDERCSDALVWELMLQAGPVGALEFMLYSNVC